VRSEHVLFWYDHVISANAGISGEPDGDSPREMPAFAGMTIELEQGVFSTPFTCSSRRITGSVSVTGLGPIHDQARFPG
jgi:hypothetical protein